ncbi:MAG: hypothetical protein AAGE59_11910 [Cyanobacteria bacterium P01_F01_bin.86]
MKVSLINKIATPLIAVTTFAMHGVAHGATFSLESSSQGWYNQDGRTNSSLGTLENTFTGTFQDIEYRSYFTFDVSGLESPIESATLQLFQEFYFSGDLTETVTVYDVTSTNLFQTQGVDVFADLGSGSTYGEGTIAGEPGWNPIGGFLEITLSDAAIADINEAQQTSDIFSLGLTLTSIGGIEFDEAEGIRFSDPDFVNYPANLILESAQAVPEPFTLWGYLLAMGLGAAVSRFKNS